ncbi:MAG: class I SAM-dependent methyltransferase [Alphaproteobacteria bacterium]
MTSNTTCDPGSFRDRTGTVYVDAGRILRTVREVGRTDYCIARDSGILAESVKKGFLIETEELDPSHWPDALSDAAFVLQHRRVPYVSYPYEWSFSQLKAAALLHLDFQLDLLENGFKLSDASAYNVQFIGARPVFIDLLSIKPYRDGEFWTGHRQFCEQFLNPLLLRALVGIPHNAWYRGALEGIATVDLARLIPFRRKFSWNVFSQVLLQARFDRAAIDKPAEAVSKAKSGRKLSRAAYRGFLLQLRNWIDRLQPADTGKTIWGEYAASNTYTDAEADAKKRFITQFAEDVKPPVLVDLGCNTGDYSMAALDGGAGYVIGFDFDQRAVDLAFSRSREQQLAFLPLWFDAANPSPSQGWREAERKGFGDRTKVDAVIALAFEHHLAIARNVPLDQLLDWIVGLAPQGVIEFVPKDDPTIRKMLALREDIFDDYSEHSFRSLLEQRAEIVDEKRISESGRVLFRYSRKEA